MHTVLITGATDGLGLALASHYRQHGSCVILVGRRPLEALTSTLFTPQSYCRVDLTHPDAPCHVVTWLTAQAITTLDLVIHNAGVGYVGDVATQGDASIAELVDVNFWAPVALTHALYPHVQRIQGRFVYISSVAADLPGPQYAVYTATKAALDGFVRNWRAELAADGTGVTAQIIHPGPVRTAMHAKSGADPTALGWDRFPPAQAVAAAIEQTILRTRADATIGRANRLVQWSGRHLAGVVDATTRWRKLPAHDLPRGATRPHALITGGADGIGRALAHALAGRGFLVTGVDHNTTLARRTQAEILNAGGAARFVAADLSTADGVNVVAAATDGWTPFDVLIHNAGISCVGAFVAAPLVTQRAVLAVNLVAPLLLTARLLRDRSIAAGAGLVFIASLSHFIGYPGASVYAATKDGLAAYARSLRVALAPDKVRVLVVYPGPTRTAHARQYSPDNRREQHRMAPDLLAAQIVTALDRGQRQLIPGFSNRLLASAGRVAAPLVTSLLQRTLYAPLANRKERP